MVVLSMAVSGLILSGSGFNQMVGINYATGLSDAVDNMQSDARGDIEAQSFGGVTLIGLAITAITMFVDTFVLVYLFPFFLLNIGFPAWFSIPVGIPFEFANIVGTVQILRGLNLR